MWILTLLACMAPFGQMSKVPEEVPPDTDTDADADTDTDTDADTDTDTDTDTDADADTDADTDTDADADSDPNVPQDLDGDGYLDLFDCDDTDPTVFPGAPELCNGVDDDCDGQTPEDGRVTRDGTNHATLADALAAGGSDIAVCTGTFTESLTFDTDTVIRAFGPVTLRGAGDSVIRVTNADLELHGVEITGGLALEGGGIRIENGTLRMESSAVLGNTAESGGGIYAENATLDLIDSVVHLNMAEDGFAAGGGITAWNSTIELMGTTLQGNSAVSGGAMWVRDTDVSFDPASGVISNIAAHGGGAYVSGTGTVAGGWFAANHADFLGGGVYLQDTTTLDGAVVENNDSVFSAGGVLCWEQCVVRDTEIRQNSSEYGAGIELAGRLEGSLVTQNEASWGAGGVYAYAITAPAVLDGVTVLENTAPNEGGGIVIGGDTALSTVTVGSNTGSGLHVSWGTASLLGVLFQPANTPFDVVLDSGETHAALGLVDGVCDEVTCAFTP